MDPYLFYGVVLPERAQISLQFDLQFTHLVSGVNARARISIILNQVVVWVDTDHNWDIHDLRNVVLNILQSNLAMVGYLRGFAYDCFITRVINRSKQIDYVFGIDIPCLANRTTQEEFSEKLAVVRQKSEGPNGVFMHRCLSDLVSAMRQAEDTGFFCYRAIESLRNHCAATHDLAEADRSVQWLKFREVAGCSEQILREIKTAADPLRHGKVDNIATIDRAKLLTDTWDVVDRYIAAT